MTLEELTFAVSSMAAMYPTRSFDVPATATAWLCFFREHRIEDFARAARACCAKSEHPPTVAELLRELGQSPAGEADQAFRDVLAAMLAAPERRSAILSPRAIEAVRRLGGWRVVGTWTTDTMHYRRREFREVYDAIGSVDVGPRRNQLGQAGRDRGRLSRGPRAVGQLMGGDEDGRS